MALSYVSLVSSVESSFWNKLSQLKLDIYKSDEIERQIWGCARILQYSHMNMTLLEVDSTSFNANCPSLDNCIPFHGKLLNTNTIEKFKECDKQRLINSEGSAFFERIQSGEILKDPSMLNWFMLFTFADIKRYHYYYWFAFPVPKGLVIEKINSTSIKEVFTDRMMTEFEKEYNKLSNNQTSYFLVFTKYSALQITSLYEAFNDDLISKLDFTPYFVFVNIGPNNTIGSQLRLYVAFILYHCPFLGNKEVKFLSLNSTSKTLTDATIHTFKLPEHTTSVFYNWVGWEKNERDNMGPRVANMRNTLDPIVIAETSVDLNLKLMKWNLVPKIDLEKIKKTKCLVLGSGTLGCSVARTLLGWGVRHITFVDNAVVSSSNPVRQSLFTYQDSLDSKPKATAAADMVKLIFPGVVSEGFKMNIPMPGHPVGQAFVQQTKDDVNKLIELIDKHDVIFLLMDSRESRWLPTLLGADQQKIVINAALGFDSYLVMRHGIYINKYEEASVKKAEKKFPCPEGFKSIQGCNLGCYFCTDVSAPGDSLKNRTLDQQCTVTRPGVSQIAGALAVELAISVLQHKEVIFAPAFYSSKKSSEEIVMEKMDPSVLGLVPHSIRGFLSSLEQFLPATEKYKNCVACSEYIINEYRNNGMKFLFEVFSNSKILEDTALLSQMCDLHNFDDVIEYGTDEEFSISSYASDN